MTQVTVNGNTYSDDGSASRDMLNGGSREWFFPLVSDFLVDAGKALQVASTSSLAIGTSTNPKTVEMVEDRPFAVGAWVQITYTGDSTQYMTGQITAKSGTTLTVSIDSTNGSGTYSDWTVQITGAPNSSVQLAQEWAIETASDVNGSGEYSAKEYAQGTQSGTGGSAKRWATQDQATGQVDGVDYSAKAYAQQDLTGSAGGSSKDWATTAEDSYVDGSEYSAKHYARKAAQAAGEAFVATSGTSLTLGTGSQSLTLNEAARAYGIGTRLTIADASSPDTKYMSGVVTSYADPGITVDVDAVAGGGYTGSDWVITAGPAPAIPKTNAGDPNGSLAAAMLGQRAYDTSTTPWTEYVATAADGTVAGTTWEAQTAKATFAATKYLTTDADGVLVLEDY